MALELYDRVKETSTTTGTGTLTLAGAVTGYRTFGSVLADADTTYYAIELPGTAEWEVGLGTVGGSGTTLARTTVLASSNAGAAVNFSAGTKNVFVTTPATLFSTAVATFLATPSSANLASLVSDDAFSLADVELGAIAGLTSAADKFPYFTGSGTAALADLSAAMRTFLTTPSSANFASLVSDDAFSLADTELGAIAGLTSAANKVPYFTGSGTAALADLSSAMRTFMTTPTSANLAALVSDDAFSLADAELGAIAGLTSAADRLPYFTGSGAAALATFTSAGRAIVDDADASAQRTTLGLVIGTDVQAYDADLAAVAGLSSNGLIARTGAGTAASRTITGTASEITVSNGDGVSGNPTLSMHADYGKGRWVQLSTATASASSTIDFTAFDSSKYDNYRIEFWGVKPSADAYMYLLTSTNGGSSYDTGASNYMLNDEDMDASGYVLQTQVASTHGYFSNSNAMEATTSLTAFGKIEIFSPATAAYTQIAVDITFDSPTSPARQRRFAQSIWRQSAADVDAIRIAFDSGATVSVGEFRFYGRRK